MINLRCRPMAVSACSSFLTCAKHSSPFATCQSHSQARVRDLSVMMLLCSWCCICICNEVPCVHLHSQCNCLAPLLLNADELERGQHAAFSVESRTTSASSIASSVLSVHNMQQQLSAQLMKQSMWPAALALFLSVSTSILVFPFFPYIPSSGYFGGSLPQVCLPVLFASTVIGALCVNS